MNSELNGSDPSMAFCPIIDVISNRPQQGRSVNLTPTVAAALFSGKYTSDTKVNSPAQLLLPQTIVLLVNEDGKNCGGSNSATLTIALRYSCNTAFGGVGLALGVDALSAQVAKFGFDT